MLERRQGSGTYVIAASEVGGTLGKYFADAEERDVLELRQALDTTAAALAARRRDEADIATLKRLLSERSKDQWNEQNAAAIQADVELHRAIVVASHNAVYLEFYDSLLPTIEQVIRSRVSKSDDSFDAEHIDMVQAVIDGDSDRAAQAARCFLDALIAEYPDAR